MRPKNSAKNRILGSKGMILVILFAVTGFLGLPLLWMSPAFSRIEKIAWSVINVLYTSLMIAACAAICWWSYNRILGIF